MTPGQSRRAGGFRALLLADGESLALEGSDPAVAITAIVNRTLKSNDVKRWERRDGATDFEAAGMSQLEFLTDAMTLIPKPGFSFIDADSVRHRIRTFERTEFTWVCLCSKSDVI